MTGKNDDERYSDEEAAGRRDAVVKRMLNTPPKPRLKPRADPIRALGEIFPAAASIEFEIDFVVNDGGIVPVAQRVIIGFKPDAAAQR